MAAAFIEFARSPGFLRVWTRAGSRHQCRCPPAHTDHVGNLRVLAADREVSDQAEEMWPGRRLDCRTHHWPGQMADVSATAQAGRRLSRLLRRLRRCAAPH